MYAVVRMLSVKPGHAVTPAAREENEAIARQMRGSLGQITIDIGEGKWIRVALWTSAEERETNVETPEDRRAGEIYGQHLDMPIIGRGEVISNTLQRVERQAAG